MKTYKVLVAFKDLEDNDHIYTEKKPYPREGSKPSEERINELLSSDNKRKEPLIVAVDEGGDAVEFPKHTGGGHYELSNGEKVKGKEAAVEAEAGLKEGDQ